jgi:D-aminopeptidase
LDARELPYFSSAQLSQDRDPAVAVDSPYAMTSLFRAAAEATEEAILNALCMAETMIGKDGRTIHALPLDRVQQVMRRYRPS